MDLIFIVLTVLMLGVLIIAAILAIKEFDYELEMKKLELIKTKGGDGVMINEKTIGVIKVKNCDEIYYCTTKADKVDDNKILETISIVIQNTSFDDSKNYIPVMMDRNIYNLFIEAIDTGNTCLIKIYGRDEKLKNLFQEKLDEYVKTNNLQDYYIVKVES